MKNIVEIAKQLACKYHCGQFRRDEVTPYIVHPAAVAHSLAGESEEVVATAWLHDVLEDTKATPNDLLGAGLPYIVVGAVMILSRSKRKSYKQYLSLVAQNDIARRVKIADMMHNLRDAPTEDQIIRYCRGLLFLMEDLYA